MKISPKAYLYLPILLPAPFFSSTLPYSKASIHIKRSGSVNLAKVLSSMSIKLIESGLLVKDLLTEILYMLP